MSEDHLPELSESEKEEIQKEAELESDVDAKNWSRLTAHEIWDRGFIAGASLQLRKAKKREAGWVSVKERLPEAGRRVIIEGGMGFHMSGVWYTIVDEGNRNPLPIKWTVRVWMPLPKPPKEP